LETSQIRILLLIDLWPFPPTTTVSAMFGEVFVVFDYIKKKIFLQRYSAIRAQETSKFKSLQK